MHYYPFTKLEICAMQENIPLEEVFEHLQCTKEGLNSQQVQERLDLFGHNKLEEKKVEDLKLKLSVLSFPYITLNCCLSFSLIASIMLLQESKILKFLGFMWNPLSWVMEAAAIMAIAMAHGGVNFLSLLILFH